MITYRLLHRERQRRTLLALRHEQQQSESSALAATTERLRLERTDLLTENRDFAAKIACLQTALAHAEKQADRWQLLLEATRKELAQEFHILAERIIQEKNNSLTRQHQTNLEILLRPVREQLTEFKKKVEDVYDRESKDRISLVKEIEHLKSLNERIGADAISLTNALKGRNKLQGSWGEMILEQLLEDSGLRRGHEFTVQPSLKNEQGNSRRPDVIVRLPEERTIIIDSKVSLKSYEQANRCESPEQRQQFFKQHVESVKKHILGLAGKNYHQLQNLGSLDFVLLFLPIEGAFQSAVAEEPDILVWAMRKKVILTSPSTLLAILRTINHLWRLDEQSRNGLAIAKQAGSLYDKFIGFIEAFEEIGLRLEQSLQSWKTARKRLSTGQGNIIAKAELLKNLGVQSDKSIPSTFTDEDEKIAPQSIAP